MIAKLMQRAVLNVFNRSFTVRRARRGGGRFPGRASASRSRDIMPPGEYVRQLGEVRPLQAAVQQARGRGTRPAWPPRSSSCWRACTSARSSTRTCRPATPAIAPEPDAACPHNEGREPAPARPRVRVLARPHLGDRLLHGAVAVPRRLRGAAPGEGRADARGGRQHRLRARRGNGHRHLAPVRPPRRIAGSCSPCSRC